MLNTSREVIKEGALNFKIGSSCFVNVTVEVIDKYDRRQFTSEECKRDYQVWRNNFQIFFRY